MGNGLYQPFPHSNIFFHLFGYIEFERTIQHRFTLNNSKFSNKGDIMKYVNTGNA